MEQRNFISKLRKTTLKEILCELSKNCRTYEKIINIRENILKRELEELDKLRQQSPRLNKSEAIKKIHTNIITQK